MHGGSSTPGLDKATALGVTKINIWTDMHVAVRNAIKTTMDTVPLKDLHGIKIAYEPAAMGFGEAPISWSQARAQRSRWIRGVYDANRQFARQLFVKGLRTGNSAMLDGAFQAYLPSYSVLTVTTAFFLLLHVLGLKMFGLDVSQWLIMAWAALLAILFFYPILVLALENAPAKAYLVILTGPLFILWRLWLTLVSRFGKKKATWVRTAHKGS
jgi:cellulose synthase/poly-beta-1,6-N-acetylglucosamine synthase-like glycosyltransferase